ncbi:hypothetical protein HCN44_006816 [Aphidius gifuensis]|uniref:Uncharacterized protein n=1 Tax=Aphidius gifuensis TaxID=684658 RepID=A0A834Y289_APHGI|nr:hypothetical protein HCN44_006816 [Aphidius gifuensis]
MSGILQTLRFAGTTKYATNILTNYQLMGHRTYYRHEDTMSLKGKNKSTSLIMKMRDASRILISKLYKKNDDDDDEVLSSKLGSFIVSIESSKIALIIKKTEKNFILPVAFNTTLNGVSIKPLSNKIAAEDKRTISFKVDQLSVAIDGYKLKLNVNNRAETDRVFDPQEEFPTSPNLYSFGIEGMEEDELKTYDDSAKIKLEYPMNIFVQGFCQVVKIHETGESFTIYHTVELQALKEIGDKTVKTQKSKIGKFDILLLCGDLLLERRNPEDDKLLIKQELWIQLDLDDEEPAVYICPFIKRENFQKE